MKLQREWRAWGFNEKRGHYARGLMAVRKCEAAGDGGQKLIWRGVVGGVEFGDWRDWLFAGGVMVAAVEAISESKANGSRRSRGFGSRFALSRDGSGFRAQSVGWLSSGAHRMVQNLYQGMLQDPVTGLYYERARWYSPSLGTWISQDPLQYINGANTYQFVMGNPVGHTDLGGEWVLPGSPIPLPATGLGPLVAHAGPIHDMGDGRYGVSTHYSQNLGTVCTTGWAPPGQAWQEYIQGAFSVVSKLSGVGANGFISVPASQVASGTSAISSMNESDNPTVKFDQSYGGASATALSGSWGFTLRLTMFSTEFDTSYWSFWNLDWRVGWIAKWSGTAWTNAIDVVVSSSGAITGGGSPGVTVGPSADSLLANGAKYTD